MSIVRKFHLLLIISVITAIICDVEWKKKSPTCDVLREDTHYCEISNVQIITSGDKPRRPNYFYWNGDEADNNVAENIRSLSFKDSVVNDLPRKLFIKLRGLEMIQCVNCKLQVLNTTNFGNATKLKEINFQHNEISNLENDLFNNTKNMLKINLAHNQIETISDEVFRNLHKLKVLNLANNLLEVFLGSHIYNCTELKELYLQHNKLTETFYLFSHYNQMSLNILDISQNQIQKVTLLITVAKVAAGHNQIVNFVADHPRAIIELELNGNQFQTVEFLQNFTSLKHLDLSQNSELKGLDSLCLASLIDLEQLYLQNINLQSVEFTTFEHQTKITILDISNNHLKTINFQYFMGMKDLQQLLVDENDVELADLMATIKIQEMQNFDVWQSNFQQNIRADQANLIANIQSKHDAEINILRDALNVTEEFIAKQQIKLEKLQSEVSLIKQGVIGDKTELSITNNITLIL